MAAAERENGREAAHKARGDASASAGDGSLGSNPHAERISAGEFSRLVREFYGTRTLVFDRPFAEEALRFNTANRRKLAQLADQMRSGEFENTGQPAIVSAEGVLNDGQHRLLAVVEADAVADMDVRFGIPRRVFTKTDTGASRTRGDVLTVAGAAHGAAVHQRPFASWCFTGAACRMPSAGSSATTRSPGPTGAGPGSPRWRSG